MFAIAITLLVLEITVPAGSEDDLLGALADQWSSYLAYVVSFSTIGAVWLAHNAITEYLDRANAILVRLNLLLLLVVAFLPFPTRLLAEYIGEDEPQRVAATVYGATVLLIAVLVSGVWRYAVAQGLLRRDAPAAEVRRMTARLTPGLGGYVVMIVLGLFLPIVAVVGYLAIAIAFITPFGLSRRGSDGSSAR